MVIQGQKRGKQDFLLHFHDFLTIGTSEYEKDLERNLGGCFESNL